MPAAVSLDRQAERVGHRLQRGGIGSDVELHVAAEEVAGVEHAEREIGVGDGRLRAAAAVACRAGIGARRFGSDLQQAELVDARQAAAARADLHEVDRGHDTGKPEPFLKR